MKTWFYLIIILLQACVAKNQPAVSLNAPDYFILIKDIQQMEMDPLGHIYLVDDSDRIFKFDTTGQRLFTVVNNNLGRIHSLDVGNPFKIMAFYRDQQTILLFDNTLSEIQRIPLARWNLFDVTAAGLSPDNAIWVFDGSKKVLMKMSAKGEPIITSDPFDIIKPVSQRPDYIFDLDNMLLLKETGQPMALFNDFGNYLQSIPITTDIFSLSGDMIIINEGPSLVLQRIPTGEQINSFVFTHQMAGKKINFSSPQYYAWDDKGIFVVPIAPKP